MTSARLLVTSLARELGQFDELRRVQLPDYTSYTQHAAAESPTGTFIAIFNNTQLRQYQVSEVNTDGQLLHASVPRFTRLCSKQALTSIHEETQKFVVEFGSILLLDA